MDQSKKQTIALCAAFIAAPRLMFLDQDSAPALRAVLSDSVWKAELLLEHIDAREPHRHATRPEAKTDPYFDLKNELHAGPTAATPKVIQIQVPILIPAPEPLRLPLARAFRMPASSRFPELAQRARIPKRTLRRSAEPKNGEIEVRNRRTRWAEL
jgi:hypothetical protein